MPHCGKSAAEMTGLPDPTPFPLDRLPLMGAPERPALLTREGLLDYAGLEAAVGSLAAAL